ncbi:MAG: GspE/PulE family protein [Patescibacteria group bacterium]|nr:GspE/PulE family protein [Patescibacteria group bacterium]
MEIFTFMVVQNNLQNDKQEDIEAIKAKAKLLGVSYVSLSGKKISVEVLKEIPEETVAFYNFAPFARKGDVLDVGMVDPEDLQAKEALRFIAQRSGLKSRIFIISQTDLENILKQYKSFRGEIKKALQELEEELKIAKKAKPIKKEVEEIAKKIITEAPITKIVAVILRHAIEGSASDIHIEPAEDKIRVRFRVDGILHKSLLLPKEIHSAVVSRVKILSNLKIDETRVPQDGRFRAVVAEKKIDFRVSTFPTIAGEKVVLRVLDSSLGLKSFDDLGIQGCNLETLENAVKQPFGMILISGPTGSGKSTTLYAVLNSMNKETTNIVSLEDPVEYYIEGISQSQIKPEIKYNFASGLRHILRQDPDVIMVGEIRDQETAGLAVHSALTGHILLSTIHTNNAVGVIPRLVDMGVNSFLLPPSINLAIAQRLIRRLCPHCKKEIAAPLPIEKEIESALDSLSPVQRKNFPWKKPFKIYRPVGCKFCDNSGTKGRIALYEMLRMTPELEEIINEGMNEAKMNEEAKRQGMTTIRQDGISKVLQGIVSFEEMSRVIEE